MWVLQSAASIRMHRHTPAVPPVCPDIPQQCKRKFLYTAPAADDEGPDEADVPADCLGGAAAMVRAIALMPSCMR